MTFLYYYPYHLCSDLTSTFCNSNLQPATCNLHDAIYHQVIVVLDNCGLELVSDLLLVDGLLRCDAPPAKVPPTERAAASHQGCSL